MQVSVGFLFFRFKQIEFLLFSHIFPFSHAFLSNSVQVSNARLGLWIREPIVIHRGCKIELI